MLVILGWSVCLDWNQTEYQQRVFVTRDFKIYYDDHDDDSTKLHVTQMHFWSTLSRTVMIVTGKNLRSPLNENSMQDVEQSVNK